MPRWTGCSGSSVRSRPTASGRAWYLQLDIRNYFMRIDKAILWRLLAPHIADDDARWLTELLVFHDCTDGHIVKGAPGELEQVPPHKSLLRCEPGKGLPIGNLNSQFFANVYLNGLDQFVKHQLRCRHYLRYCDDFVLLSADRERTAGLAATDRALPRGRAVPGAEPARAPAPVV